MNTQERLEQTRQALAEMWCDEEATAERLKQLVARTHSAASAPGAPPPAIMAAASDHETAACQVRSYNGELALCAAIGQADRPYEPAACHPAADSESGRVTDLVERAQAGEADAFGRLYDQYSDTVYRYIYYRVGGKA
ncbi:hypothetical protein AB0D74_45055, partial [Streptomyces sp. NPDC048278]